MASSGWKSWSNAFTRCGPHFDITTSVPQDLMHVEAEGLLKGEAAAMIFSHIRNRQYYTLEALNRALDQYAWPSGNRPPYFTEGVLKGRNAKEPAEGAGDDGGYEGGNDSDEEEVVIVGGASKYAPKSGCHIHMTAGQTLLFARHSPTIFARLNVPSNDPALKCWLTHLEYLNILMQQEIDEAQILEMEALVRSHQEQMKKISEYDGLWKPKHHSACHFGLNIRRFGPPRHYWCMRFEALNQLFKRIAIGGSFRETCKRCAEFWVMRSAMHRQRPCSGSEMARTRPVRSSPETFVQTAECDNEKVAEVLRTWPNAFLHPYVSTQSVSTLVHEGATIFSGTSWLQMQVAGTDPDCPPVLAHVPTDGIFTVDGAYFLWLYVYPNIAISSVGPTLEVSIPENAECEIQLISIDELMTFSVLWPTDRLVVPGSSATKYRFISHH